MEGTDYASRRLCGDAVERQTLLPSAIAGDDADGAAGKAEHGGEITAELLVGRVVDGRSGHADEDRAVTLAVHGGARALRNDADIDFGAGGG